MANYANLEAFIQSKVYENANNEITGQGLQDTLLEMVKELGKSGFICQGVATTSTTPPVSSDSNIFYFAEGAGTYTNFGGLVVGVGELALFFWNGSTWDKESCNIVEIIDNLTTNDSTKALSAKQGKVLNDALQALRQTLASIDILDNVAGSAVGLLNPIAENAEFTFQKSGSKGDGAALINSIKGKTLSWNQFFTNGDFSDGIIGWYANGVTLAVSGGVGVMTALSAGTLSIYNTLKTPVVGHKYLVIYTLKADAPMSAGCGYGGNYVPNAWSVTTSWQKYSKMLSANSTASEVYVYGVWTDTSVNLYAKELQIIDLTLLGIDNLTTVEEVEAWLATNVGLRSYYPFNAGELKSNDAQSIVTEGRNQWDEEYTEGNGENGDINYSNKYHLVSKNFIPVFSGQTYYIKSTTASLELYGYDSNKNKVATSALAVIQDNTVVIPSGVYYIKFQRSGSDLTYNHDICINISDASFNGQYEPYWKNTLELNIKTLTGKKDGQGASVTIFPNGACGVGSVYDELRKSVAYKRFGIVDLGDLNWTYSAGDEVMGTNNLNGLAKAVNLCPSICSAFIASPIEYSSLMPYDSFVFQMGYYIIDVLTLKVKTNKYSDAVTFKTAMNGVKLIYQLDTPETYVLDTPLNMTYKVAKGGTEERTSPNADGISAPMVEEVHYPMQTKGDADYIIGVTDGNPATIILTLPIDATGAVFLSCGGATFSALVSAGQATLSISGIASGTYTFVAMYSGDEKYAPFSASDTVTIS